MKELWSCFVAVLSKELLDAFRDRRSLASALLYPLLMPLLIGGMFQVLVEREAPEQQLELPVVGAEHAPELIAHLKREGVKILDAPADPEAAVRDGDHGVVLVIPQGYGKSFSGGEPARLELVFDTSKSSSRRSIFQARSLLHGYGSRIGTLRLAARGVSPTLLQAVQVEEHDLATPKKRAASVLNMVPMLAILACFVGGMQVAIDTTAGERERGSFEPLLLQPVPRTSLVVGKWLTAVLFALLSSVLTVTLSLLAMSFVELESLGLQVEFNPKELGLLLLLTVPICAFASSLQTLVATFARSFKEAQTYLSLLLLLPMMPGMVLTISPLDTELWMLLLPLLGQTQLMADVLRGDSIGAASIAITSATTLALAALCLLLNARLLDSERVVFGR